MWKEFCVTNRRIPHKLELPVISAINLCLCLSLLSPLFFSPPVPLHISVHPSTYLFIPLSFLSLLWFTVNELSCVSSVKIYIWVPEIANSMPCPGCFKGITNWTSLKRKPPHHYLPQPALTQTRSLLRSYLPVNALQVPNRDLRNASPTPPRHPQFSTINYVLL